MVCGSFCNANMKVNCSDIPFQFKKYLKQSKVKHSLCAKCNKVDNSIINCVLCNMTHKIIE